MKTFLDGRVSLHGGDAMDVVRGLADNSIDSVCTDPPYALVSIAKRFGKDGSAPAKPGSVYARASSGFMNQSWDVGDVAFNPEFWAEVLRVLKPGGHVAAFGGTRSYHRLACAIEDAGFEIRDQLAWTYGSGFPKSQNVARFIDKELGVSGSFGSAKSPAHQHFIDKGKFNSEEETNEGWRRPWMDDPEAVANVGRIYLPSSEQAKHYDGFGTALKPAWEPICLARKPLSEKTVAANVLRWGTGAINVDGCRVESGDKPYSYPNGRGGEGWQGRDGLGSNLDVPLSGSPLGRWPANLCLSWPEDEYEIRPDITKSQLHELSGWFRENA